MGAWVLRYLVRGSCRHLLLPWRQLAWSAVETVEGPLLETELLESGQGQV